MARGDLDKAGWATDELLILRKDEVLRPYLEPGDVGVLQGGAHHTTGQRWHL